MDIPIPYDIPMNNDNIPDLQGLFQVNVTSATNNEPLPEATVQISSTGEPDVILEEFKTNESGQTDKFLLEAPPFAYSQEPLQNQPYSEYNVRVILEGYEPVVVSGAEILPKTFSWQNISMRPLGRPGYPYVIGPHTLYGYYPPKITEAQKKTVEETGQNFLYQVVIPEYIVVHDGAPEDSSAANYYVPYRDYIKNVASCEIYATWPESCIYANVLAIMSFTLNRVYTEWYRNKGYNFTITSSTAYDHKWINGKNVYDNISYLVDSIFSNYLSRPNVNQPILTQYCDGKRVTCPNWMSQWGSKNLGEQGYSAIDILRYYYGDSIYINTARQISGIPASFPGENLTIGSRGDKVRQIQEQLNRISDDYPRIPKVVSDGIFGEGTANAVRTFQTIFNLPVTGIIDYPTWYKISEIYVGVSRIAELN